ncbi:MAG: hypothetical protein HZC28_02400 [Spirochaetes bacterium]|nr:hypothetical protein [Spirochaetota bacterium]
MKNKMLREVIYLAVFLALAMLFFFKNIGFDRMLSMGDTILWANQKVQTAMHDGLKARWDDDYFILSRGNPVTVRPSSLIQYFVPAYIFPQINLILHLFFMGYFAFLLFRYLKLSIAAAFFGALAFMFTNDTLTLVMSGHMSKFETFSYFPLILLFLHIAMDKEKIRYFIFAGAFLGISFLGGEVQVAAYFAVLLGCYFLYLFYRKKGDDKLHVFLKNNVFRLFKLSFGFIILAVVAVFFSLQSLTFFAEAASQGEKNVVTESREQKWDWATQWSFPPEEIVDFVAPGIFGYYSGSPTHPYIGRMASLDGKAPWRNFKYGGENIGLIVAIMALLALALVRKRGLFFWGITALIVLLISFGRYLPPFFGAVFSIPGMQSFRNPNKFVHLFTLAVSILSAFGADYFFRFLKAKDADELVSVLSPREHSALTVFNRCLYALVAVAFVTAAALLAGGSGMVSALTASFGDAAAQAASKNAATYGVRFFFMAGIAVSLVAFMFTMRSKLQLWEKLTPAVLLAVMTIVMAMRDSGSPLLIAVGLIASVLYAVMMLLPGKQIPVTAIKGAFLFLVVFDLWYTGQFFVETQDQDEIYRSNPVVRMLRERKQNGVIDRVKFLSQNGVLNFFVTHLFPANDIPVMEPPAMSRWRSELLTYLNRFRINDVIQYHPKMYQLLNVRYLVNDFPLASQLSNYLIPMGQPLAFGNGQSVYLYEMTFARPRYEIVNTVITVTNLDEAMNTMTAPTFDPLRAAVVYDAASRAALPKKALASQQLLQYGVKSFAVKPNRVDASVFVPEDAVFVLKDMHHPDWNVFVDGKKSALLKVNVLTMGVYVPAGDHAISFRYEPFKLRLFFWFTFAGWMALIAAGIAAAIVFFKRNKLQEQI